MTGPDPWEGLLDPGEEIVWQGQPEPGVRLEWNSPLEPFFPLFVIGFSVFWMQKAMIAPGPFWTFGLLFFGIGAYNLVGVHFWKAHRRRSTFYTLTDRRAFIGANVGFKRTLDSYPIGPETRVSLDEGRLDNIWFAERQVHHRNTTTTHKIGFERLKDGRAVFAKLRDVQRQQANRPTTQNAV